MDIFRIFSSTSRRADNTLFWYLMYEFRKKSRKRMCTIYVYEYNLMGKVGTYTTE